MSDSPPIFHYSSEAIDEIKDFDKWIYNLWDDAMTNGVMRYTLDHITNRTIQGKYGFIVQNNRKRFTHRRTPFEMTSLIEPFSEERFHFNKVSSKEILFKIERLNGKSVEEHIVIVNVSPIEYAHFLLVPYPTQCLPQIITEETLTICLELLAMNQHRQLCLLANSLLAYASINHLHYHFLTLDYPLLVTQVTGRLLVPQDAGCYEVEGHPLFGFGFQMTGHPLQTARQVCRVIKVLIEQNIPHNLFALKRHSFSDNSYLVTVFLFPRRPAVGVKAFYDTGHGMPPFFVAASEIGGFLPIIDETRYPTITEEEILLEFKDQCLSREDYESLKLTLSQKP